MSERPEPFLFERIWSHPASEVLGEVPLATAVVDEVGRIVGTRYADGAEESYEYDGLGRVVAIEESESLYHSTGYLAHRVNTGGRLRVEYDEGGVLRIVDERGRSVWERLAEPFAALFERGVAFLALRCVRALTGVGLDPETEIACMRLVYVSAHSVDVTITVLFESDREEEVRAGGSAGLWYPESYAVGLLYVEEDEHGIRLLRETALRDPRDAQRVVFTAVAQRLARHDWSGVFTPTEDFVVFIAEHDEDVPPKCRSVLEVNPPERLAAWKVRLPRNAIPDEVG